MFGSDSKITYDSPNLAPDSSGLETGASIIGFFLLKSLLYHFSRLGAGVSGAFAEDTLYRALTTSVVSKGFIIWPFTSGTSVGTLSEGEVRRTTFKGAEVTDSLARAIRDSPSTSPTHMSRKITSG